MKITTQKEKVTPLIFNENYKNNESKMGFPQKQGGGDPALVENSTKNVFFKPSLIIWKKTNLEINH